MPAVPPDNAQHDSDSSHFPSHGETTENVDSQNNFFQFPCLVYRPTMPGSTQIALNFRLWWNDRKCRRQSFQFLYQFKFLVYLTFLDITLISTSISMSGLTSENARHIVDCTIISKISSKPLNNAQLNLVWSLNFCTCCTNLIMPETTQIYPFSISRISLNNARHNVDWSINFHFWYMAR